MIGAGEDPRKTLERVEEYLSGFLYWCCRSDWGKLETERDACALIEIRKYLLEKIKEEERKKKHGQKQVQE